MDLLKLAEKVQDTLDVHLESPSGELMYSDDEKTKPCVITIFGPASDKYRQWDIKNNQRLFNRAVKKGSKPLQAAAEREVMYSRLAYLTASVTNLEMGGEAITPENIIKVYRDQRLAWVTDQVNEKLNSDDGFLPKQ